MNQWEQGGQPEATPARTEQASPVFTSFRDWITRHGVCDTKARIYGLGEELTGDNRWVPDRIMVGEGPIEYKANVTRSTIEESSPEAREAARFLGIHNRGGLRMRYRERLYVPVDEDELEYRPSCLDLHVVLRYVRHAERPKRVTARYRFEDHPEGGSVLHGYLLFGFNMGELPRRQGGVSSAECEAFGAIALGLGRISDIPSNFKRQKLDW